MLGELHMSRMGNIKLIYRILNLMSIHFEGHVTAMLRGSDVMMFIETRICAVVAVQRAFSFSTWLKERCEYS